ncbi:MAG: hypothetical protein LBK94_08525 [Prevotellaceae bacterium]|jgi:hypothetical protein|nr:hypothetical protein [Prevotellaceae bacterium]
MIMGFKVRFKEPIKQGVKIHSVREDKKRRWRNAAGKTIHMSTGVRTRQYECFKNDAKVKSVHRIDIKIYESKQSRAVNIFIDGRAIFATEVYQFIRNDGFANITEFLDFFKNGLIDGTLIQWTDFDYNKTSTY